MPIFEILSEEKRKKRKWATKEIRYDLCDFYKHTQNEVLQQDLETALFYLHLAAEADENWEKGSCVAQEALSVIYLNRGHKEKSDYWNKRAHEEKGANAKSQKED